MNRHIENMVARNLETVKLIVEGKGEISDVSRSQKHAVVWVYPFGLGRSPEVFQIPYDRISDDEITLIPLKGAVKRV